MKKLISIFIVSLMFVGLAWAQGYESFTNLPTDNPNSYQAREWVGDDGVTWTAIGARTSETIDGRAICFGNSGDRWVTSPTYLGGMGNLTFKYVRGFTGTDARSIEVYVNGNKIGETITVNNTSNDVVIYNENLNIEGNVVLEIRSTGSAQVKVDEIEWTSYGEIIENPILVVAPLSLDGFFYTEEEGPSAVQNFAVQGSYLNGDIELIVDSNFEIALDDEGPFTDALTLTAVDEAVESTPIYVRMIAGLDVGDHTGNITVSTDDADNKIVVLEGEVYNAPPTDGYFVDFEDGDKSSWASADTFLNGKEWNMTDALVGGNLDADWKNGEKSARLRGYDTSSMTMLEDKANGLGTLSFFYRCYGTEDQVDWKAEYSTDQGSSWIQIGDDFTHTGSEVLEFNETVNVPGNVRIRIVRATDSGRQNRRLNIDDIFLSDYTGGMPVAATPAFSPDGGYYTEAQTVSITSATEDASIRYTIDGSTPSEADGEIYVAPIVISEETTLKAIAYKDGHLPSGVKTAEYTFPVPPTIVENIAALRAGATGGTVYHLTGEAILTYQNANRNTKYIQDDTAAIVIDDASGKITTEYALYDGITGIMGTLNSYSGLLQFVPTENPGAATSSDNVIEPVLMTIDQLASADQAKLVKVEGLTFVGAPEEFLATAQNLTATDGTNNIVVRTFVNTDYAETAIPTEAFDLIAVVGQFNADMQLHPRFLADFTIIPDVPGHEITGGVEFPIDGETDATIVGDDFIGADHENVDPADYTPFPNADFTPAERGVLRLYGTGYVNITVQTDHDWFAWVAGGMWNAVEGGTPQVITVNLDAKNSVLFEYMTGNGFNPTLPVELSYFTAIYMVDNGSVMLSWKTESETQMLGYRIYRSEDRDLENALMITPVIIDATNSSTGAKYSHTDSELNEGTYYYWLEAVGYNSSEYYGYQSVVVENPAAPELPSISSMSNAYPNPFRSSTKVDIEVKAGETANFTVYNMLGQAVYTRNVHEGQTTLEWNGLDKNGRRCGSGIYFYKLSSPSTSQTKKMVILK